MIFFKVWKKKKLIDQFFTLLLLPKHIHVLHLQIHLYTDRNKHLDQKPNKI